MFLKINFELNHSACSRRLIKSKKHYIIKIIYNFFIFIMKLHFLRRIKKEDKMIEGKKFLSHIIVLAIFIIIRNAQ